MNTLHHKLDNIIINHDVIHQYINHTANHYTDITYEDNRIKYPANLTPTQLLNDIHIILSDKPNIIKQSLYNINDAVQYKQQLQQSSATVQQHIHSINDILQQLHEYKKSIESSDTATTTLPSPVLHNNSTRNCSLSPVMLFSAASDYMATADFTGYNSDDNDDTLPDLT